MKHNLCLLDSVAAVSEELFEVQVKEVLGGETLNLEGGHLIVGFSDLLSGLSASLLSAVVQVELVELLGDDLGLILRLLDLLRWVHSLLVRRTAYHHLVGITHGGDHRCGHGHHHHLRSNHHLAFNPEERQRIIDRVLEKRSITLSEIENDMYFNPRHHCKATICRLLKREGLKSRGQPKKFYLNTDHMYQRYHFGLFYENWTEDDWSNVIFSDESKLFATKMGRTMLRKYKDEKFPHNSIIQK